MGNFATYKLSDDQLRYFLTRINSQATCVDQWEKANMTKEIKKMSRQDLIKNANLLRQMGFKLSDFFNMEALRRNCTP